MLGSWAPALCGHFLNWVPGHNDCLSPPGLGFRIRRSKNHSTPAATTRQTRSFSAKGRTKLTAQIIRPLLGRTYLGVVCPRRNGPRFLTTTRDSLGFLVASLDPISMSGSETETPLPPGIFHAIFTSGAFAKDTELVTGNLGKKVARTSVSFPTRIWDKPPFPAHGPFSALLFLWH